MASPSPSSRPEHLCVLVHGLWGNPIHLTHLRDTLQAQYPQDRLHILVAKSNADNNTYDGIEVGGERITNEIEQEIKELEAGGAKIKRLSITGYSLGGLISRYAVGLLYKNGVFNKIEPVNFTTFATPHLGIRTPSLGYRSDLWNVLGSRTLSTSGQQMFTVDDFRGNGRPLLSLMADQNSIFVKGLRMFKHKSLYANTMNDRSVPYYTAGISRTDPFVDLDKVDVHYLPDQDPSHRVLLDPQNPVSPRTSKPDQLSLYDRWNQARTTLPFYAIFFTVLPIAVPIFLVNSVYQNYQSAQRVRLHEAGETSGRFRIRLLEDAQAMQDRVYERLADQTNEEYLPTPPPEQDGASEKIKSSSSSSSSSSSTEPKSSKADAKVLARVESTKNTSPFPTLALTSEQFDMIDSLDTVGFVKYPAHIQQHRHTHAAIVVRTQKDGFDEGRAVVRHWVQGFEV